MLAVLLLIGAVGTDGPVSLGTGARMCAALGAEDFRSVGLTPDPALPRPPNSTEPTGAYCTYTKAFPVDGGLELDIFDGESDPAGVFRTILAEGGRPAPAGLIGVDESAISLSDPGRGSHRLASLAVRHRRLVFVITIPAGPEAQRQLTSLAKTVLGRVNH